MGIAEAVRRLATGVVLLLALLLCLPPRYAMAQAEPTEYEVKAAFLYNFAKFATWPDAAFAGPGGFLDLCVLGSNEFGTHLEQLSGQPVEGRTLRVLPISLDQAAGCHLLFVSRSEEGRAPAILDQVRGQPVLTVGDHDGFAERGGVINLQVVGDNVRFEINPDAAQQAGIALSSQLLRLATIVEGGR